MSINTLKTNKIYVGIDVSKHFIDVAIQKQSKRFTYNKKGLQDMLQWLTQKHPKEFIHIIFEPTGGYEITLAEFLQNEEVLWSRPNPLRIRQYARALGVMAKTCLLYTSPSPRDQRGSRMPSSA